MNDTKLLSAEKPDDITYAANLLQAGKLVAIPTETVYGLAANALDPAAVAKIFMAKGRPQDNPLIVHVLSLEDAAPLVKDIPPQARQLAEAFWPGPLTIVLEKSALVPEIVSAGLGTVALRSPSHPAARALLQACGLPLAAPSANRSGSPSPTTAQHVMDDMAGRIAAVLDGGNCGVGVESTVVTLAASVPTLLRPGGISPAQLRTVLGELNVAEGVTRELADDEQAQSPGMKHRHYAPKATLTLAHGSFDEILTYAQTQGADGILCFDEDMQQPTAGYALLSYGPANDPKEQARQLFAKLREIDQLGLRHVLVRCPAKDEVGLAVYNRLLRASEFREVNAGVSE